MKRYISLLVLAALVLAAPAIAQEHAAQAEAQTNIDVRAGVTPDSALYGLKTAFERTRSALTFSSDAKADLNLRYANKRLAEIEAMLEANNTQAAQRAANAYETNVETAAQASSRASSRSGEAQATAGLEQATKARAQLQANLAHAANVHANILARQETRMDDEQYAQIENVFASITQAGLQADTRIEEARVQSKQRYQATASVDAAQADAHAANISAQQGLDAQLQAHQNALGGLNTALQASVQAGQQAQTTLQQRINELNTSTSAGADIRAGVAGINVGAQTNQETTAEREEREQEETNTTAQAQANGTVQINGQNTRAGAGAQGGVQIS